MRVGFTWLDCKRQIGQLQSYHALDTNRTYTKISKSLDCRLLPTPPFMAI